jgi:glycosyltransferase involved in cell wall biosynthesis
LTPRPREQEISILALAPNAWDGPWLNRQQILSRIGRRHYVLYSTGASNRDAPNRPPWRPRATLQDQVTVDVLPGWMAAALRQPILREATIRGLAWHWRRLLRGQRQRQIVVWCFHPKFWHYIPHLRPDRLVYHAYDLYHSQGHWDAERAQSERELVTRADVVIASSQQIADYLRSRGAASPLVVENAADYAAFALDPQQVTEPPDLAAIPRPRLGYTGSLNRKVDFPLLARLASRRPQWQFVFVGAVGNLDADTTAAIAQLQGLPNAHFLGFKLPSDLPRYVIGMDVNLLTYRVSGDVWTEGIYPLKLHEYLAAGRPVVSADLPSVRPFAGVVRIAKTEDAWEPTLAAALLDTGVEGLRARRLVARQNDWDARVEVLEDVLAGLAPASR